MKCIEVNLSKITHFGADNQKSARKIEGLDTPNGLKERFQAKNMDEVFLKIAR